MSMVDTRPAVSAPATMTGRVAALAGAVSFALILLVSIYFWRDPALTVS